MAPKVDIEPAGLPVGFAARLAAELRRKFNDAPSCILHLDARSLAQNWGVGVEQTKAAICEASRLAGLAVGIIGNGDIDIMTSGTATQLWAGGVEIGQIARHNRPSPPKSQIERVH